MPGPRAWLRYAIHGSAFERLGRELPCVITGIYPQRAFDVGGDRGTGRKGAELVVVIVAANPTGITLVMSVPGSSSCRRRFCESSKYPRRRHGPMLGHDGARIEGSPRPRLP